MTCWCVHMQPGSHAVYRSRPVNSLHAFSRRQVKFPRMLDVFLFISLIFCNLVIRSRHVVDKVQEALFLNLNPDLCFIVEVKMSSHRQIYGRGLIMWLPTRQYFKLYFSRKVPHANIRQTYYNEGSDRHKSAFKGQRP